MSQIIAIELDRSGLRAALVDDASTRPRVAHLACVEGDTPETAADIATALRKSLPDVRWSRARLVGVVAGDQLRCRLLELPPVPDAELPDIVRMQAAREFASAEGQAVVDYLPLSHDESAPRTVLAATIEAEDLSLIEQVADELDAPLEQVVTRGGAATSLAERIDPRLREGSHLVVSAAGDGVDLTAVESGVPTLLRSTRLSQDAGPQALASESRRTGAMAAQQSGRRIESTAIMGFEAGAEWKGAVTLGLVDALVDSYGLSDDDKELAPRLSGVIGAALNRADETRPAFDFLHPRRPVKDNSQQRRLIWLGGAAAACVILGIALAYSKQWSLDRQITSKESLVKAETQRVEDFAPIRQQAAAVEKWLATDVNWLDELERLGRQLRPQTLDDKEFPADQDVYLRSFTATRATERNASGGRIDVRAVSRNPFSYDEIEQRLRDDTHEVETSQGSSAAGGGLYSWETQTFLRVEHPEDGEMP